MIQSKNLPQTVVSVNGYKEDFKNKEFKRNRALVETDRKRYLLNIVRLKGLK